MSKFIKFFLIPLVILAIIFTIIYFIFIKKDFKPVINKTEIINNNTNQFPESKPTDTNNVKSLNISDVKANYSINANYPEITFSNLEIAGKINQEIFSITENQISDFKSSVQDYQPISDIKSQFNENFQLNIFDENLLSINFTFETYFSGAAHPNQYAKVFNYDLKQNKEITLSDIFKKDSNYLKILSDKSIINLKKTLGNDFTFEEGVSPNESNFVNFVITKNGLEFLFDPYQVAAYAAGPQSVIFNYNDLKDIINPTGPLGYLIGK